MLYLPKLSSLLGVEVYLKMELNNIGGSVKDRTAKEIIKKAMQRKELSAGGTLIEGTSGSTGIALSLIGNVENIKSKIILPDNLAQEKYSILEIFNAELIKVPARNFIDEQNFMRFAQNYNKNSPNQNLSEQSKNSQIDFEKTKKNKIKNDSSEFSKKEIKMRSQKSEKSKINQNSNESNQIDSERPFFCDQFDNFDNFWVHYNETGPEIFEQLEGRVNAFVCSSGTGGTLAGISRYLKQNSPSTKVILADCEGSSLFSHVRSGVLHTSQEKEVNKRKTPDYTVVEGIGQNRLTKNYMRAVIDSAEKVSDLEAMHMAHFLIQNEGIFVGGSTCLNLVAVCKYVRSIQKNGVLDSNSQTDTTQTNARMLSKNGDLGISNECKLEGRKVDTDFKIVTIANDSGYRYLSKFYNPEYVKRYGIEFVKQENYKDLGFIDFSK